MTHIVILGCGFGGLEAARTLARADVRITLIDRSNHHLFQPLLYQVATAGLSGPAIAAPIRHILARQRNLTTLMGSVTSVDVDRRMVMLADGGVIPYDHLIVATGSTHSYFGNDEWAEFAPGLKTLGDAFEIRRRILMSFEHAEREVDEDSTLGLADLRRGRRRRDRRGDGRDHDRNRPLHAERRIPPHRLAQGEGRADRRQRPRAAALSAGLVGESAYPARATWRRGAHRLPRDRDRRRRRHLYRAQWRRTPARQNRHLVGRRRRIADRQDRSACSWTVPAGCRSART